MKRLILAASTAFFILACSNGGGEGTANTTTNTETTDHGGHGNAAQAPSDTAASHGGSHHAGGGASMMALMQANMEQMKAVPSTGNPDNDFAALMKIHHMGALDMAQAELAEGTDPQLKAMARKMIDAQQREIAELNTFLSGHAAHGGGDAFYKEVMGGMNNMNMEMDHGGSVDKQFVQMMIPHHQGAIDMARAYLKSGAHEEKLKGMAGKMITDQQKEIAEMQAWLNKNK